MGTLGRAPGQLGNPSGLAVSRSGVVYVADLATQFVHMFTTAGEWLDTWSRRGINPGELGQMSDIAVDAAGYVYITERSNGGAGVIRVQKFTSSGEFVTHWGLAGNGSGQLFEPEGLDIAPNGDVYVADTGNDRIQRFSSSGAFLGMFGSPGTDTGQFDAPADVVVAADGSLFVSDQNNSRIQHFSATGTALGTFGTYGVNEGDIASPHGLALDSAGNLIIGDATMHMVHIFSPNGSFLRRWGAKGTLPTRVFNPEGLTLDSSGHLYVTDGSVGQFKKYAPNGQLLAQFGAVGDQNGFLNNPHGIAVHSSGNIYVADTGNHRIQVFSANGSYVQQWGNFGDGNKQFRDPIDVALDMSGNVYVVDSGNNSLQKFSSNGVFQWKLGGPVAGSGNGEFNFPRGIAVSTNGTIYVADTDNSRIQMISGSGTYLGQFGVFGHAENQLSYPADVSIGPNGDVFITDYHHYRIQRYSSTGSWLSNYGLPGISSGNFILAARIAVGSDNRVYIGEHLLGRVQVLRPVTARTLIATITQVSPQSTQVGTAISLRASAHSSSSTAEPVSYAWYLDQSSTPFAIGEAPSLPTVGLATGKHTITLRAQAGSELAEPRSVQITLHTNDIPQSWTFLLYLDGDNPDIADKLSDSSSLGALYRLSHSTLPANLTIVALFDGDGPNDSIRMTFRSGVPPVKELLQEQNMGDPATLVNFVQTAQKQAPADAYYLALADHGTAIDGLAWDLTSASNRTENLTNTELRLALLEITAQGSDPIDVLHLDACLLGTLEMAHQLRGVADYMIVSENLGWSAFAYDQYQTLVGTASTPETLALSIVEQYAIAVKSFNYPMTIAVLKMQEIDQVTHDIDVLSAELLHYAQASAENRLALRLIRDQVQQLDTDGNLRMEQNDDTVDIVHLAQLLMSPTNMNNVLIRQQATQLYTSLGQLILKSIVASGQYNSVGVNLSNAHGLAIYYPTKSRANVYTTYQDDLTFAAATDWDEFLQAFLSPLGGAVIPREVLPLAPLNLPHVVYLPFIQH